MQRSSLLRLAVIAGLHVTSTAASAGSFTALITDDSGKPVADAVVYADPLRKGSLPKPGQVIQIEQKDRQFVPAVTVVQTGTSILFPNNDKVRHHVYSFSPAKTFELKLYSGVPGNPVEFDKPGTVVIGCNIHDKMVAYIHVVDTPYHAKTDAAGRAVITELPAGSYLVKAWHPNLPAGAKAPEQSLDMKTADAEAKLRLNVPATGRQP